MTENKRFKLKYINEQHISANIYDNKTFIGSIGMGEELIVDLLNDLSEENEQLKQFQEQVFNLIDKKLEENKELDGVDTAMYYANKGTLNELKKELQE